MPPHDSFPSSRYPLSLESPITGSEELDLTGANDVEFTILPRAVWIEVAAASTFVFKLAGDDRFQARTITSTGWYPWRVAEVRPSGSASAVKTAAGVKVIGDY